MSDFNLRQFKSSSQDYKIASLLLEGKSREEVIRYYFPFVGKQEPFVYRENIGGGRRRKPMEEQYRLFLYNVNRTMGKMRDQGWSDPEPYSERQKWSSKERHWVRFRRRFIQNLLDEGVSEEDRPGLRKQKPPVGFKDPIPAPGTVTPVDPQGNPLGSDGNRVDLSPAEYDELFNRLYNNESLDSIEFNDNGEAIKWHEFDEDNNLVAEWILDENNNHTRDPKLSVTDAQKILEEEERKRKKSSKAKSRAELIDEFYKRMMIMRDFVITRELGGEMIDFISTRAVKDGAKAIAYGIGIEEVLGAVSKTWSNDTKNELQRHERPWKMPDPFIDTSKYPVPIEGGHMYLGYMMTLASARIPIFCVGPAGCGKSFAARDLAYALELDYGEIPLTAGATPSWLTGAETISGYKSRPFVEIYENGGVFCFEEIDAADPNMLLLVNNAIANESFFNPVTGKEIEKHKNVVFCATANTWGVGANRQYTGRERLDAATLDRWRVGRIEFTYDQKVEESIIAGMKKLAHKLENPKPKKAKV